MSKQFTRTIYPAGHKVVITSEHPEMCDWVTRACTAKLYEDRRALDRANSTVQCPHCNGVSSSVIEQHIREKHGAA